MIEFAVEFIKMLIGVLFEIRAYILLDVILISSIFIISTTPWKYKNLKSYIRHLPEWFEDDDQAHKVEPFIMT